MEHRKPTLKCELEEWKDIPGYEGLYQVSNKGRIRSLSHLARNNVNNGKRMTKGRVLTPYPLPSGYLIVKLSKNEKREKRSVHRLVAKTFIENKNNLPEVNHIDGDKTNNNINNLEWVTRKENQEHLFNNFMSKAAQPVICLETQRIYRSMSAAGKELKTDRHCIKEACESGLPYNNLHWRYYRG